MEVIPVSIFLYKFRVFLQIPPTRFQPVDGLKVHLPGAAGLFTFKNPKRDPVWRVVQIQRLGPGAGVPAGK